MSPVKGAPYVFCSQVDLGNIDSPSMTVAILLNQKIPELN